MRWKLYEFVADPTTLRLRSEGHTLIEHSEMETGLGLFNFFDIATHGIAKLKVHQCAHLHLLKNSRMPVT
jgi:hypothetical protein